MLAATGGGERSAFFPGGGRGSALLRGDVEVPGEKRVAESFRQRSRGGEKKSPSFALSKKKGRPRGTVPLLKTAFSGGGVGCSASLCGLGKRGEKK